MAPSTFHKVFILLSCTFLGLICGTLYLYSSYSPQLASRLQYSATNASSAALVGSLGVAATGPLAGVAVDRKGYTIPLLVGGLFIVVGYGVLRHQFVAPYSNISLSCLCLFMVGSGSTFINSACLKCCAVTFPSMRGVATSLPLALYGLSAMFYSTFASLFYPGDTAGFLKFIMVSSVIIFVLCCPMIMHCDWRGGPSANRTVRLAESIEMINIRGLAEKKAPIAPHPASSRSGELHGVHLLRSYRFWLLFIITGSLASLGQMYIYSVGYIVKALVIKGYKLDPTAAESTSIEPLIQSQQQIQVGLLSVMNCVGRLVAGVMADIITQTFRKSRGWLLFLPACGLAATQVMSRTITSHETLSFDSMLSGFFYGYCLCLMPIIVGDAFGIENFSGNWGLVGLAPVAPSFYLTNLFGKVYDSRSSVNEAGSFVCIMGNQCYGPVFNLSLAVSVLAIIVIAAFNFEENYGEPGHDKKTSSLK